MNNVSKTLIFGAIVAMFLGGASFAMAAEGSTNDAVSNGSDDSAINVPYDTTTGGTSGSITNGEDDLTVAPTSQDATPSTGGTSGSITNGQDDLVGSVPVPPTPEPTPTPIYGGGGSSSGGSRILFVNTASSSCPLLTSYLKFGGNNDSSEVTKLQLFLKNSEGMNLTVNGTFDQVTFDAVRAFQQKYVSQTMGPWGSNTPTGFVYITTRNKINEIACNRAFALTDSDLAIINAFKNRLSSETVSGATSTEMDAGSSSPEVVNPEIGSVTGPSQTAAVGNTSILAKFWNFILDLFR